MPWLGFFERWSNSDFLVILDDVQFLRRGWHHRDKILSKDGVSWLTVPVLKKGKYHQLIKDVEIDDSTDWRLKHLNMLNSFYRNTVGFERYYKKIEDVYALRHTKMIDLNLDLLRLFAEDFSISTPLINASSLKIESNSSQRLVDIVLSQQADEYLTGMGSKEYLDVDLFTQNGIKVIFDEYQPPIYKQCLDEFIPKLSTLDFLMRATASEKKRLKFSNG